MPRKTYLLPRVWRRGSESMVFVKRDQHGPWLGVYSDLTNCFDKKGRVRRCQGSGDEYAEVQEYRVSCEFYRAFLKESRRLHEKLRPSSSKDCKERHEASTKQA